MLNEQRKNNHAAHQQSGKHPKEAKPECRLPGKLGDGKNAAHGFFSVSALSFSLALERSVGLTGSGAGVSLARVSALNLASSTAGCGTGSLIGAAAGKVSRSRIFSEAAPVPSPRKYAATLWPEVAPEVSVAVSRAFCTTSRK